MKKNRNIIAFLAFAMYFLTGASCIVVGSSLPQLVDWYNLNTEKVVLLGTAFALGRLLTVYFMGRMVEKVGPKKIQAVGVILITVFLVGIPATHMLKVALCCAFLGGIGFGTQDAVCPLLVSVAFPEKYASMLSAGQACFGCGNFMIPFFVGILLSNKLPFYLSYYFLVFIAVAILICLPFAKIEVREKEDGTQQTVKPLYTKRKWLVYGAIIVSTAAYAAVVNTIMLYTSSFAQCIGVSDSASAFMLTAYNLGCITGSLVFILILRKIAAQKVLLWNNIFAGGILFAIICINKIPVYFAGLFIAGCFLGVLFSVIVSIATRVSYDHISRAGSIVAMAGGASDSLNPIVTGNIVGLLGVTIAYKYAIFMILLTLMAAVILSRETFEQSSVKTDIKNP